MAPDFLGEFASSFSKKEGIMKERMLEGKTNPLRDRLEKHFLSNWIQLDHIESFSANPGDLGVAAVDSSVYTNPLSTGGIFYVVRSLAVCKSETRKLLETDVVFTKGSLLDAQRFVSMKMEMLEFQVALNFLKEDCGCSRVLIDGSLYGRAVHLPIETKIEEQRLTLLDYLQTFREFLEICKNKDIVPIGVSKESRADFYRNYLLRLLFDEELENVSSQVDPIIIQKLKPLFLELLSGETAKESAFRKFSQLKEKCGDTLELVTLVFEELTSSRPDYQLIMSLAESTGYTKPLLLGPSPVMSRFFELCRNNPERYVRRYFPITYREKGQEFVKYASNIVSSFTTFPGIVSLHLLLDAHDSPIRVDLPYWDQTFTKTGWPKPVDLKVDDLLNVMVTGYGGLDCHNLWLKNVDERVRLKKKVVDNIYFPYMEKMFGEKIIRGRSYRRVKYP